MSKKLKDPVASRLLASLPVRARGNLKFWAKKSRRSKAERKRRMGNQWEKTT
jgi:hypothetical protein